MAFLNSSIPTRSKLEQLTKAIPKMARKANNHPLQAALRGQLKESKAQVLRLEEVAKLLHIKPTGKKCIGMNGLIEEAAAALKELVALVTRKFDEE